MGITWIDNLHNGMNLRDIAQAIAAGEVGLTLGCDFHNPGQVTPMNKGKLTWTLAATIIDAKIVYLRNTRYLFTTHADGLRVNLTSLIDADFTGTFKAWPLNDEYVVLSNSSLNRKWKPEWTTTYQWGLNTPPAPTLAAGTALNKTVDDFEDLTKWSFTGGGAAGNLQADTTHNRGSGAQSMRLTATAETTITASRSINLDLSKFVVTDDQGTPYLQLSYYTDDLAAIQSIVLKLSCAANRAFTKDYYKMNVTLGGYSYVNLSPTGPEEGSGTYETMIFGPPESTFLAPSTPVQTVFNQQQGSDNPTYYTIDPNGVLQPVSQEDLPTTTKKIIIKAKSRDIPSASATWTDLKLPLSKFTRIGSTAGRDWSTITAISIEVTASAVDCDISFDDWLMIGGGNLFGWYYAAVAYQNEQGNYGPYTDFEGPVELDAQSLMISGLTADTDGQTKKRRIAILGGSITSPMVHLLENNTDTSLEYNEEDSSLTTVEYHFNNRKPPAGIRDMAEINGRIFAVCGTNSLVYSESLLYEAFPLKNYRTIVGGEQLYQVSLYSEGYVAARGKGREYITQVLNTNPAFWQTVVGAKQGAVSSRLMLEEPQGFQVYMSERGFYGSGPGFRGEYLEKINPVITNHSSVFGDMIPDRAYLCFQDTGSTYRVMRIDWRLGKPIAHYVSNLQPSAIFADNIVNTVYYASGTEIYEFDADTVKLAATLTIPGQLCGTPKLKSFEALIYELSGDSLTMTLVLDRVTKTTTHSLAARTREETPKGLPQMTGMHLGLTLTSVEGDDFVLYLPWGLEAVEV